MTPSSTTAAAARTDPTISYGPAAWLAGSAIALVVTATAATVAPGLAHHDDHLYALSGIAMTIADALVFVGVIALARAQTFRPGRLRTASFALAVAGSAGIVVAEEFLRIDDTAGNSMFSIVGPMHALGFVGAGVGIAWLSGWRGWHRLPLLTLGLYIPLVLVPLVVVPSQAAGKEENLLPLAGYHLLVGVVGFAFHAEQRRTG